MKKRSSGASGGLTNEVFSKKVKAELVSAENQGAWHLQIEKQPPDFPFHETFFPMQILLVDSSGKLVKSRDSSTCLPLEIDLLSSDDKTPIASSRNNNQNVVEISSFHNGQENSHNDNFIPAIGQDGRLDINVKILELSSFHGGRKFCLRIAPKRDVPLKVPVLPAYSEDMKVVSHRLVISDNTPETWYKDQGGRENCIEVIVKIEGPEHKPLTEDIPLSVKLLYDDQTNVRDPQDKILMVHPDSVLTISKTTKETSLKLRIEDVSKNHQSKGFVFLIEPQKVAHKTDISRVLSSKILVKSKVNRSKKKQPAINGNKPAATAKSTPIKKGLLESANTEQIRGFLPNASQSGAVRLPPSALPSNITFDNVSKAGTSTYGPAVRTAAWCDAVKDALFELQAISVQRLVVENRLWKLLGQYGKVLPDLKHGLEKEKIGVAAGSSSASGNILGVTASTQRFLNSINSDMMNNINSSGSNLPHPSSTISMMMSNMTNSAGLMRGISDEIIQRVHSLAPPESKDPFQHAAASVSNSSNVMTREHSLFDPQNVVADTTRRTGPNKKSKMMEGLLKEYESSMNN
eukprot:CAMPEP_0204828638 /NCGR_PEP_ID=MMETSP1346-20131115/6506_1 /ASSEMBLY_ACC=CAM_ASM_000771 /TAXON_ID=215587 /ORGANISM="Aplanochytrium stocchinoi, Strain GSBS06" /LENGTH=575 /DNA_ID=CAMNT_0051957867 /DNA_START=91 /DNA_END=1818 /DNA_ORIENTATION=+